MWIGIEKDTKAGTPIVPAPTPIKEDIKPIIPEKKKFINFDKGKLSLIVTGFFINIFIATNSATIPNTNFKSFPPKNFPIKPPIKAPKNIPKPHFFKTSISIEPLW